MLYKEHPQKMLKICLVGGWTRPTLFTPGNKELSLRDVCRLIVDSVDEGRVIIKVIDPPQHKVLAYPMKEPRQAIEVHD